MPPREWRVRIEDILDAAGRARRYVAGMDLAAFVADERTRDAVSRCLGIIGEAAVRIPAEIVAAHPENPLGRDARHAEHRSGIVALHYRRR